MGLVITVILKLTNIHNKAISYVGGRFGAESVIKMIIFLLRMEKINN